MNTGNFNIRTNSVKQPVCAVFYYCFYRLFKNTIADVKKI